MRVLCVWLIVVGVAATTSNNSGRYRPHRVVKQYMEFPSSHAILEQTFYKAKPVKQLITYQGEFQPSNFFDTRHKNYHFNPYTPSHHSNGALCMMLGACLPYGTNAAEVPKAPLVNIFEWKQIEYDYASDDKRQDDIDSGFWVPGRPVPIDIDVHYTSSRHGNKASNKIFVTMPRFQAGTPVTLATVSDQKRNGDPILKPFPEWSWHRNPEQCKEDRLISVFRIKIDECSRIWVLDTGTYGDHVQCPPQILAFTTNGDLLHRFTIPDELLEKRSVLVTPVVDIRNNVCKDTFVYVADCQSYAIITYDVKNNRAWKIIDKSMYPDPDAGTFNIQGETFDLMDGVLGMALEPYIPGREDRKLYYSALSSHTEHWVYTSDLRNETFIRSNPTSPQIFHNYKTRRPSQSCAMAIDREGIAYFGLMDDTSINCWNVNSPDYGNYIESIYKNSKTMQFASGVKIINNAKSAQELWIMTSRFQKIMTGTIDPTEVNFRIHAGKLSDIAARANCKKSRGGGGNGGGRGNGGGSQKHNSRY